MKNDDLFLIIDMQNVYKKGGKWECENTENSAKNINKILNSGIKNVIFTRFIANEKNPLGVWKNYNLEYSSVNKDEYANKMIDEFSESLKKFPLYTKSVYSSLSIKKVKKSAKKAKQVVISGVIEECCVLSTIFALIDEGIYIIYLTDAISGLTKQKEDATKLILSGLCPLHLKMMTTEEYLNSKLH